MTSCRVYHGTDGDDSGTEGFHDVAKSQQAQEEQDERNTEEKANEHEVYAGQREPQHNAHLKQTQVPNVNVRVHAYILLCTTVSMGNQNGRNICFLDSN